ncbi:MAG TPA: NAD(P)-binding protein [Tepidisphaeraceae bacterium]|jgi:CPA2 family monovalent cation:H+ antiporter-2|nr:NAD(P)-binding protein [Tepidisphaeraceae bacterium]
MASSPQYLLVIGYGVPGRAVVDLAKQAGIEVCVVENNAHTVQRCAKGGPHMIAGDARDPTVLQQAEISRASLIVVAIPDQEAVLQITRLARELNKTAKIIARCHYTSVGFELHAAGASEVIVAEQVVAREMSAILTPLLRK